MYFTNFMSPLYMPVLQLVANNIVTIKTFFNSDIGSILY